MNAIDMPQAPFHCESCGEPLYVRTLACPHCGAADPVAEPEPGARAAVAPDAVAPAALAARAATEPEADGGRAPELEQSAAAEPEGTVEAAEPPPAEAEPAPAETGVAETATGDEPAAPAGAWHQEPEAEPVEPRHAAGAALDIAPERRDEPEREAVTGRDLVVVPERGGREVGFPRRRRSGALATALIAAAVLVGVGAAGLFAWRQLGPILAETGAIGRSVVAGRAWKPLDLDAGKGSGEWVLTASGPFRIRIDGTVYTVTGPVPFSIPLEGKTIEIRSVEGDVTVTLARRGD
jgi:hypothetical protein